MPWYTAYGYGTNERVLIFRSYTNKWSKNTLECEEVKAEEGSNHRHIICYKRMNYLQLSHLGAKEVLIATIFLLNLL